jgi:hypothetical protein
LKGKNGERLALINGTNVTLDNSTTELQLPTGAVTVTTKAEWHQVNITLTATTDEDGEASACTTSPCVTDFNIGVAGQTNFTLGKTSTGGTNYLLASNSDNTTYVINVIGDPSSGSTSAGYSQPTLMLIEEKDDSSNRYSLFVSAGYTASSGNNLADAATPTFTYREDSQTRGSDSNVVDYVDLYGAYVVEDKNDQNSVTIYYPDDQVYAVIGAGDATATASVGGASGTTVDAAVVITSPVAKLASEINTDSLSSDLILIGGPCANSLLATLAETSDDIPSCADWDLTTGLIKEVEDAFGSGQKALVVAGTTADDTRNLAADVMGGTLDYST